MAITKRQVVISILIALIIAIVWKIAVLSELFKVYVMGKNTNIEGTEGLLKTGYPRGILNNNPGNIIMSNIPWLGKIPTAQNTDKHFEQFYSFAFGLRAMIKNFIAHYDKGADTIHKMINTWSEPYNPAYENFVSRSAGISKDEVFKLEKENMSKIIRAMVDFENKPGIVTEQHFNDAYSLL